MNKYMQLAISEAKQGIDNHHGGPFGSVVVKDGRVIAMGHNHVLSNNDSTCHGEIDAVRKAEQRLKTFDLTGCDVYTTGQCCPMCLFALKWANVNHVYYGCTLKDNEITIEHCKKIGKILGELHSLDYNEINTQLVNLQKRKQKLLTQLEEAKRNNNKAILMCGFDEVEGLRFPGMFP